MGQEEVPGHVEAGGDGRAEQEGGGLEQGGAEAASINLRKNLDGTYPYAIPVNYFFDAEHDKIYFHGAKAGHKVDALKRDDKICFTVYGNEWYKDGDWAPYVMSTVVFGRCRLVDEAPAFIEDKVRQLALKYYPSAEEVEEEIAKDIKGVQLYEISIEHLCGKQIHEK